MDEKVQRPWPPQPLCFLHPCSLKTPSFITREPNMIQRKHFRQLTSLDKSQKALEAYGSKPWLTNFLIFPPYTRYTNRKCFWLYYFASKR